MEEETADEVFEVRALHCVDLAIRIHQSIIYMYNVCTIYMYIMYVPIKESTSQTADAKDSAKAKRAPRKKYKWNEEIR